MREFRPSTLSLAFLTIALMTAASQAATGPTNPVSPPAERTIASLISASAEPAAIQPSAPSAVFASPPPGLSHPTPSPAEQGLPTAANGLAEVVGPGWAVPSWLENVSFFGGLDGSKQPQDLGVNANMGGRFSFNWGTPLLEEWGLGMQAGFAYSFADAAVQVLPRLEGTDERNQYFVTLGLFERTDFGLNISGGYDILWEDYYDRFQFGQWRGRAGYELTSNDEVGAWFTIADRGDSGSVLGIPLHLRPISQVNAFWRHTWSTGGWTTFWIGAARKHGRFVLGLPDDPPVQNAFVYGADLHLPLNNWLALFGEANFITPPDSGTVDAYLGIVLYPGGGAFTAQRRKFNPLMPVASNPTFAVDLSR